MWIRSCHCQAAPEVDPGDPQGRWGCKLKPTGGCAAPRAVQVGRTSLPQEGRFDAKDAFEFSPFDHEKFTPLGKRFLISYLSYASQPPYKEDERLIVTISPLKMGRSSVLAPRGDPVSHLRSLTIAKGLRLLAERDPDCRRHDFQPCGRSRKEGGVAPARKSSRQSRCNSRDIEKRLMGNVV